MLWNQIPANLNQIPANPNQISANHSPANHTQIGQASAPVDQTLTHMNAGLAPILPPQTDPSRIGAPFAVPSQMQNLFFPPQMIPPPFIPRY